MAFHKIVVSDSGVEIAYTDSGAPSQSPYITIVAIHGMCFAAPIFQRAQAVAPNKGVRLIAVNRRNYPESTPFSSEELDVVNNGSQEQKDKWLIERGHEIAKFIDVLIQKVNLPPISDDGKSGGIVLLGWSVGVGEANAAIAHADKLPPTIRARFTSYIRALILHEGAPIMLGLPMPEKNWAPFMVESIPPELRLPAFSQWVTGYFDHGDLSTHDFNVLSYILPSTSRPGTIYNMSKDEQKEAICEGPEAAVEGIYMFVFSSQLNAAYRKAFFDANTRKLFPKLRTSYLASDQSPSWAIAGLWAVQKDAKEQGQQSVNLKLAHGHNHLVHWDEPEQAIDLYLECA